MSIVNSLIAEVDASAIIHNCKVFRSFIPSGCRLCAAVKCNAFGHSVEAVLPALKNAKVEMLCVANIQEAKKLRDLGWELPVLLLGSELSIYQGSDKKELAHWLVKNGIRPTITRIADLKYLIKAADACGKTAIVHLMLDSGMNRMGVNEKYLNELINYVGKHNGIHIEGLYTHLATADEDDKSYAELQLAKFNKLIKKLKSNGHKIPIIHAANSAAIIDLPQSHFDMVRPGISLYGYQPGKTMHNNPNLKPAMRVLSFITLVKNVSKGSYIGYGCTYRAAQDMTIGIVPIGYGDGYSRHLSNNGEMTINGYSVPVIGRISMDQTIVDLSSLIRQNIDIKPGHKIIVIDNTSHASNSVESLADKLGTIPNEILTTLGNRILRITG
jgi:alanine racemase